MNAYFKAMRLGRWPRSLVFLIGSAAFFFSYHDTVHSFNIIWFLWRSTLAFLLTWGISTANYIVNEIVDAPYDIHHPTKRHRPLVKGEVKKGPLLLTGIVLILLCFALAFTFYGQAFFFSLLALLLAGFIYNVKPIRTKDIPFLDSISESANNPIRFFIGWYAFSPLHLFPPVSLLLNWWAFGNFLLVAKRLSEFRLLKEKAGDYRSSLRKYSRNSLLFGMFISAVVFFVTYFYFAATFKLQYFFYLSPFVIFYLFLFFRKTLREKEVMEEPETLLKNPKFAIYTIFLILAFALSAFMDKINQ